ncbi:MAG: ABC transporter ATP-binding protein [Acidimicrobiales bacterium]
MASIIEVEGLAKEYRNWRGRRSVAVEYLDLTVPEGGVFGFLGPNGSGKTTTIRCLLGLVRPTKGRCRILGVDSSRTLADVLPRIGSVVETPMMFPTQSGRTNLRLLGMTQGIGPSAVTDALERVGLADRADDLAKNYSLGMRQRLGIAAALLRDPALLILDEPANGLDPAGIREIRELIRALGAEGRTVFISSHILSEVQQMCDRVAILTRGRCVASGTVREVLSGREPTRLTVRLDDLAAGAATLMAAGFFVENRGDALSVAAAPADAARVTEVLGREGLWLSELRADDVSLEDVFLELTGDPTP